MKNEVKKYKLLDLFCGAGGLSLGFEQEKFKVIRAIDFSKHAVQTYNKNRGEEIAEVKDICEIKKEYFDTLGGIDGIIGGPPCQGFSTAGQRIIDDSRNKLYREYFKILGWLNPKFFIIENVTGILTFAGGAVPNDIRKRANALGYNVFSKTLNAVDFGVPQTRLRVFFIGIKKDLCNEDFDFPVGNAQKVSIEDAISDLPSLDKGEDNTHYSTFPLTSYQQYVRGDCTEIVNHEQSNHSEKTKRAIALVPEGGNIMDIPEGKREGRKYHALLRKMDRKKPSLCIDTGHRTYFHYEELRVPSVREVARLQSFKDDYVFCGPKQEQYRQVGNAVPPLLARVLASKIYDYLEGARNGIYQH